MTTNSSVLKIVIGFFAIVGLLATIAVAGMWLMHRNMMSMMGSAAASDSACVAMMVGQASPH